MEELPPVSVIIATRNRFQLLREAVDSILGGADVPAEIVIVDQSDSPAPQDAWPDGSAEIRHLREAGVGLSRATNAGIRAASHELLVFTHDDVLVAPTWLRSLVGALVGSERKIVAAGPVIPEAGGAADRLVTLADGRVVLGREVSAADIAQEPVVYAGRPGKNVLPIVNMAIRHADIADVGLFDERLGAGTRFPGGDDSDLGFRLLESGFRIVYVPEATLYHRAWRPAADRTRIRWGYARGQGAFYAKHLSLRDRYMLRRLGRELSVRARTLLRGAARDRRRAHDQLITIAGILLGFADWLALESRRPMHRESKATSS